MYKHNNIISEAYCRGQYYVWALISGLPLPLRLLFISGIEQGDNADYRGISLPLVRTVGKIYF